MGEIVKTSFGSYCLYGLPDGCKYCVKGEKLVFFVTGKCATNCFYCPLSKLRKNSPKMWANERECKSVKGVLEEVRESNAKGAGITGGDPLLVLDKTIRYAHALKKEFGKNFHIHIYLSTHLVTLGNLKKLAHCVDDVRFHPVYLLDAGKHEEDLEKIKLASRFFKQKNIGIEVPLFPDKKKEIFSFIEMAAKHVGFVNLNELEIGDSNFNYILGKYKVDKNGYTVKDSIKSGLWIMKKIKEKKINLKVHLCTAETKNWHQFRNRLLNHKILPFGNKTKDGTVVYYFISKEKNEKKFEKIRRKIKKSDGYYDKRKRRILLNKGYVGNCPDFIVTRAEEYPTWDGIEVECEDLT